MEGTGGGRTTGLFKPQNHFVEAPLKEIHYAEPKRQKIEEGIARAQADRLLQQRDRLVPLAGQELAPRQMGDRADGVGFGGEIDLVFGYGVGEMRGARLGIQPERPLCDSAQ